MPTERGETVRVDPRAEVNEDGDIFTAVIDIGDWGARVECHGPTAQEAMAMAEKIAAALASRPCGPKLCPCGAAPEAECPGACGEANGIPRQAEPTAHCATCTCATGMTPAIRFDASPAEREGVIRDHLVAMGWTPPGGEARDTLDIEAAAYAADNCDNWEHMGEEARESAREVIRRERAERAAAPGFEVAADIRVRPETVAAVMGRAVCWACDGVGLASEGGGVPCAVCDGARTVEG